MNQIRPENDPTLMSVPQVILLCVLIAVVSAVATSLTVVQLVASKPGDTVFQTIEKVTETVVEKPVQAEKPTTVIVKEGDLVAKAVASNNNSAVQVTLGTGSSTIVMGYGLVLSNNQVLTVAHDKPANLVSAAKQSLSYYGSDRVALWQTTDQSALSAQSVVFETANPQVGQTIVYLGGDGSIVKGVITGVDTNSLEFSQSLSGYDIGLILDIGGDVIAIWNGKEILRSIAVKTQIDLLSKNPLQETKEPLFDADYVPETNPDDVTVDEKQSACILMGGGYLAEHGECVGIDSGTCLSLGGTHNQCASACRHDASSTICTAQCVEVCEL